MDDEQMKTTMEDWPYDKPEEGDDLHLACTIAAIAGHDHLQDLVTMRMKLAAIHGLYHIMGRADSEEHERCLQYSDQVDDWAERALKAVWN